MIMAIVVSMAALGVAPTAAELDEAQHWAAAKFEGQDSAPYTSAPFFSFGYDGRPSGDFLAGWRLERQKEELDAQRVRHTLTYTDPKTGLVVRCVGLAYRDYPTVEWTLYFKNTGAADTPILEQIRAVDTRFERTADGEFLLHHHTGDICAPDSYEPHVETLGPHAEKHIANTGGRPTQTAFPYFNLEGPGGGVIAVLSWCGQWSADFLRDDANGLQWRAGQEHTHFRLHPGEEVRGPMVVLQFYRGDWLRAQNLWRRWMFAYNVPRRSGHPLEPQASLCTGNYYPGLMTVAETERGFLQRHLDEHVPFDCWWQDAGWYPCDGVGWPKTGTWEPDPVRFPQGLRAVSDFMHANGKRTMVWFEPERVHPDTWITNQHPEWVHGGKDGGLLDLGNPACRQWLTDHTHKVLTEQGIDDYRQDFNIDPLPFWNRADTEDRQGITEIRHVEGYFAYWDELRRRHPDMLIDSCASGGRRNDLETLRRAVPLLRSDWYNAPEGQQCLTYGLALWMPYHGTGVIYEKDAYWVRSSFYTEISFGPDTAGLDTFNFARFNKLLADWRRVATYALGDFWPLTPYSLSIEPWMVWQFDRPDLKAGVVQAFRRAHSIYETARVQLRELDAAAAYQIADFDGGDPVRLSGKELMESGLPMRLPEKPQAGIYEYRLAQ